MVEGGEKYGKRQENAVWNGSSLPNLAAFAARYGTGSGEKYVQTVLFCIGRRRFQSIRHPLRPEFGRPMGRIHTQAGFPKGIWNLAKGNGNPLKAGSVCALQRLLPEALWGRWSGGPHVYSKRDSESGTKRGIFGAGQCHDGDGE